MNSIDGFGSMMGVSATWGGSQKSAALTDDQKKQVQDILKQYDPNNLSAADAQKIFKALKDAGITPGKDLRDTIKSAGFNLHQLRTLANNGTEAAQASSQGATLTDDQKKTVQGILSQFDSKSLTAGDAQSIFKQLQQAGIQPGKDLVNTIQAAGFDAGQLASLAAPRGRHHHHQGGGTQDTQGTSQTSSVSLSSLKSLQSILGQYDLNNMNTDQETSLQNQLNSSGLLKPGESINISA